MSQPLLQGGLEKCWSKANQPEKCSHLQEIQFPIWWGLAISAFWKEFIYQFIHSITIKNKYASLHAPRHSILSPSLHLTVSARQHAHWGKLVSKRSWPNSKPTSQKENKRSYQLLNCQPCKTDTKGLHVVGVGRQRKRCSSSAKWAQNGCETSFRIGLWIKISCHKIIPQNNWPSNFLATHLNINWIISQQSSQYM